MVTRTPASLCFHGGAAYSWIGEEFEALEHIKEVIDADVLDAWFDPSPNAVHALRENLAWTLRCSPPAIPTGVERALSRATELSAANLILGSGSSSLIYLALRELLNANSRVLILDPTYGEYAHVVSRVIGCRYDSFNLSAADSYQVDLTRLSATVRAKKYDMVILVNPNNPTGQLVQKELLEAAIDAMPRETMVWIDEAYIDYAGSGQSLSEFATTKTNVVVCKSLSKSLAMSGLRAGYLVSNRVLISRLKLITPPWSMSLPAQLALVEALKDNRYYEKCYARTHELRYQLALDLRACGFSPLESTTNFILVEYAPHLPAVEEFLRLCSERHLLLRNVKSMGDMTPEFCFRVAVKDAATNKWIVEILKEVSRL